MVHPIDPSAALDILRGLMTAARQLGVTSAPELLMRGRRMYADIRTIVLTPEYGQSKASEFAAQEIALAEDYNRKCLQAELAAAAARRQDFVDKYAEGD